ncbi:MAG: TOBE domain-containing protein [Methylococcaceae bacterium]|jgi:molybdopterin-binding protein
MQLSTRNQWQSTIKAINHGAIISEVTFEISPEIVLTAIVSKSSLQNVGLKLGGKAYALIKSTEVTLNNILCY